MFPSSTEHRTVSARRIGTCPDCGHCIVIGAFICQRVDLGGWVHANCCDTTWTWSSC